MSANRYLFYLILHTGAMFAVAYLIAYSAEQLGLKCLALLLGFILGIICDYYLEIIKLDMPDYLKIHHRGYKDMIVLLIVMPLLVAAIIYYFTEISYLNAAIFGYIVGNHTTNLVREFKTLKGQ